MILRFAWAIFWATWPAWTLFVLALYLANWCHHWFGLP